MPRCSYRLVEWCTSLPRAAVVSCRLLMLPHAIGIVDPSARRIGRFPGTVTLAGVVRDSKA
ncbi:hypothetical protein IG631_09797 [Alternaria alternata]|nr:hypothetical protein IG631_09797 [Alternaria alternata]